MISKEDLIEILELLFQLNQDKNYFLSDLEVYKYQKMLKNIKENVPDNFGTEFIDWKYC